jgi:hypothetical protein
MTAPAAADSHNIREAFMGISRGVSSDGVRTYLDVLMTRQQLNSYTGVAALVINSMQPYKQNYIGKIEA